MLQLRRRLDLGEEAVRAERALDPVSIGQRGAETLGVGR
jgi:hypothetical protein